ncbi:MAG: hypothetical protein H0V26_09755 [Solirubrobacterales bacterium]|nr:hypothetical protein [Solirubrobacterales bacterium]
MVGELEGEIEGTGVRAGWIKVSANDDGLTVTETKVLRAAAKAAIATGAAVGSHTVRGRVALDDQDTESAGRFVRVRLREAFLTENTTPRCWRLMGYSRHNPEP